MTAPEVSSTKNRSQLPTCHDKLKLGPVQTKDIL